MSNTLKILRHGPLMTIQDGGRYGFRAFGVSTSGAIDRASHAIANALVGNDREAATIEFALAGGVIEADEDVVIAVTGGACRIEIDGQSAPPWESHILLKGQKLEIGALRGAVWGYLAISGGISTAPVLGSRSTHLRTGLGGLDGRNLIAGDMLTLGATAALELRTLGLPWFRRPGAIRVVPGPQDNYFDRETWTTFTSAPFTVTTSRDRMAMVLDGPSLTAAKGHDIISDATVVGSIQVPGSGKPIVLSADGQTTGGYPKIATVASVDLARLAQLPSGQQFRFRAISADAAEDLFIDEKRRLDTVLESVCQPGAKRYWT
ncbi:allophanate hydrolase [Neorhizobium huautlense]|uniref:Allophanate hydrolase n=1 Tax=Neorhizobium huautlense TaxID=67774 RepID=A0ABT9PRJ0_9HYPH|nr:biotin-dependent carboxyltransferase family protein [Neorhizobium huautlense]MDP9837083.1 allophanate hydrolase [Neorhizobium huautlense]